jgi:hypothetical protein
MLLPPILTTPLDLLPRIQLKLSVLTAESLAINPLIVLKEKEGKQKTIRLTHQPIWLITTTTTDLRSLVLARRTPLNLP